MASFAGPAVNFPLVLTHSHKRSETTGGVRNRQFDEQKITIECDAASFQKRIRMRRQQTPSSDGRDGLLLPFFKPNKLRPKIECGVKS